jgi:hypothetical protein
MLAREDSNVGQHRLMNANDISIILPLKDLVDTAYAFSNGYAVRMACTTSQEVHLLPNSSRSRRETM